MVDITTMSLKEKMQYARSLVHQRRATVSLELKDEVISVINRSETNEECRNAMEALIKDPQASLTAIIRLSYEE